MAQRYSSSDDASFVPKKGQWQVSVLLGSGKFFNENTSYLLPKFSNDGGVVGLPNGGTDNSGDLNRYLNIGSLNNNSLVNIAGIEGKYFVSDNWDVNFQFSMNVSLTPKKDYVEGDNGVPDMIIPAQSYINAQMTNNWYVSVGSNYYFKTRNERIHPYLGGALGFQMARIETTEPYTETNSSTTKYYVYLITEDPTQSVDGYKAGSLKKLQEQLANYSDIVADNNLEAVLDNALKNAEFALEMTQKYADNLKAILDNEYTTVADWEAEVKKLEEEIAAAKVKEQQYNIEKGKLEVANPKLISDFVLQ